MRVTKEDLQAAARRGAAWLDDKLPGWWREPGAEDVEGLLPGEGIIITELQMYDCARCIGGQLAGDFNTFMDEHRLTSQERQERGFTLAPAETVEDMNAAGYEWDWLTEAWTAEILARRATEGATA